VAAANLEAIEELIVTYFDLHPRAMDTAEGIAEWWLMPIGVQVVRAALDRLERIGVVQRCGPSERPLFWRKEKLEEDPGNAI
jgi:hypothetical protein